MPAMPSERRFQTAFFQPLGNAVLIGYNPNIPFPTERHEPPKNLSVVCCLVHTGIYAAVLLGAYLLTAGSKTFAVASFLFAFGALFGQIGALALYLRHKSLRAAPSSSQGNRYV